ncbi:hypothetical protein [Streptomyces sp. So13.3]|uniref:hypothetical protein n=1 Tax=Streptomyces sp. So13.3 TaxID=2136173 RepID=UPI001FD01751|nr:hypothetical protein [Streptomyces sp. So13.3]
MAPHGVQALAAVDVDEVAAGHRDGRADGLDLSAGRCGRYETAPDEGGNADREGGHTLDVIPRHDEVLLR